jgi:1-phosphatidylinositol-3-phosphate 5-kinase
LATSLISLSDGRFIAKELSKAELQTMETFAPAYFDYMSSAISGNVRSLHFLQTHRFTNCLSQRPTLLAKVFGCYKLTFKRDKGTSKSKSTQMNLLVMENLFYDRHFSKVE